MLQSSPQPNLTPFDTRRIARINPDSKFRNAWNLVILLVLIFNAVAVPFRLCFPQTSWSNTYFTDWTLDLLFFIDFYLNMYEFSYIREGELVNNRDEVKNNFLMGNHFKADLATMFPLDILAVVFIGDMPKLMLSLTLTRIPKLARLGRVVGTASDLSRSLEDTNVPLAPIQMLKLMFGIILIAHVAACGLHAMAFYGNPNSGDCLELQDLQDDVYNATLAAANKTTCRLDPTGKSGMLEQDFAELGGVPECGSTFEFIKR
jgi:hypothetical protein